MPKAQSKLQQTGATFTYIGKIKLRTGETKLS